MAAANLNFDFTLVRVEAPPEYQPLGQLISSSRRQNAEWGDSHVTARKLGALFEGFCPPTPKLIRALGIRASEVSEKASSDSQTRPGWLFSEYEGIDATSLWAAATSSKAAIPVYLLACMLARIWIDVEATSVWVEIVKERRKQIATRVEDREEVPFQLAAVAGQGAITREQLAKWVDSARSWLITADRVKALEYKQFCLIVGNLGLPVAGSRDTLKVS